MDKNNQKFEEFFANEKILKQNIAILQKNNEEHRRHSETKEDETRTLTARKDKHENKL